MEIVKAKALGMWNLLQMCSWRRHRGKGSILLVVYMQYCTVKGVITWIAPSSGVHGPNPTAHKVPGEAPVFVDLLIPVL
jgi:hypothetical protein